MNKLSIYEFYNYYFDLEETGKEDITLRKEHYKIIVRNVKRLERVAYEISADLLQSVCLSNH
jgi:hypothetical protein